MLYIPVSRIHMIYVVEVQTTVYGEHNILQRYHSYTYNGHLGLKFVYFVGSNPQFISTRERYWYTLPLFE